MFLPLGPAALGWSLWRGGSPSLVVYYSPCYIFFCRVLGSLLGSYPGEHS